MEQASIIPDEYLTASHYHWRHYARNGRLNNIGGSWAALDRLGTFLQISIKRQLSIITAVATQGSVNGNEMAWVLTYKLSFSTWGDEWMEYTEDGQVKVNLIYWLLKIDVRGVNVGWACFTPTSSFRYPASSGFLLHQTRKKPLA